MAKLFDLTLDLARFVTRTYAGVTTSTGTTNTLVDSELPFSPQAGVYDGGTLWITNGTYAGSMFRVINVVDGVVTFSPAVSTPTASGVSYFLADNRFLKHVLTGAVNFVIKDVPVAKTDETLTVDIDSMDYTLPAGVSDVRIVEIASNDTSPYEYVRNRYWREKPGGTLTIYGGLFSSDDGKKIRLTYAAAHGELDASGELSPSIPIEYVRYAGAVYLWRNYIQKFEKDSQVAGELLNEAKIYEARADSMRRTMYNRVPAREICLRVM